MREYYTEEIVRMLRYESLTSEAGATDDEDETNIPPIDFVLLERLVLRIANDAKGFGILVFLPGLSEILQLIEVRRVTLKQT